LKKQNKPAKLDKTNTSTTTTTTTPMQLGSDFFEILWERSWTYIKTVVDVVREPMLILDKDFNVMAANEPFYETFKVDATTTEGESLYKLGNGQWEISVLKKLLADVLNEHTYFKGFQVAHEFPKIGRKVMILNARQIHITHEGEQDAFPPIILLAMEDVTDMLVVAESLANHANKIETKLSERAQKLEITISKLEKDLRKLQNKK
jgi:nitrogen-specific signal transduction histidine kinase